MLYDPFPCLFHTCFDIIVPPHHMITNDFSFQHPQNESVTTIIRTSFANSLPITNSNYYSSRILPTTIVYLRGTKYSLSHNMNHTSGSLKERMAMFEGKKKEATPAASPSASVTSIVNKFEHPKQKSDRSKSSAISERLKMFEQPPAEPEKGHKVSDMVATMNRNNRSQKRVTRSQIWSRQGTQEGGDDIVYQGQAS